MSADPLDQLRTGRCLDVGCGPNSVAKTQFPNMTITRLDANLKVAPDIVADITQPLPARLHGQFDLVYASHVLEHISWKQVVAVLKNLSAALAPGGQLLVLVPSLEWAAERLLDDSPAAILNAYLYGSQANEFQYHKSGFTLQLLRQVFRLAGLVEVYLGHAPLDVLAGERVYKTLQNVGMARVSELTAADALG